MRLGIFLNRHCKNCLNIVYLIIESRNFKNNGQRRGKDEKNRYCWNNNFCADYGIHGIG